MFPACRWRVAVPCTLDGTIVFPDAPYRNLDTRLLPEDTLPFATNGFDAALSQTGEAMGKRAFVFLRYFGGIRRHHGRAGPPT